MVMHNPLLLKMRHISLFMFSVKSIENKQQFSFICFFIEEFYPSISQDLLNKALDFASNYGEITAEERNIIIHAKNSILNKHAAMILAMALHKFLVRKKDLVGVSFNVV